jgi:hypothetical protein
MVRGHASQEGPSTTVGLRIKIVCKTFVYNGEGVPHYTLLCLHEAFYLFFEIIFVYTYIQ